MVNLAKQCLIGASALAALLLVSCGTNDKFDGNWLATANPAGAVAEKDADVVIINQGKISATEGFGGPGPIECRKDREIDVSDTEIIVKERAVAGGKCVERRLSVERPKNDTLVLGEKNRAGVVQKVTLKLIDAAKLDQLRKAAPATRTVKVDI